jgi:hypothetical protein
MAMRVGAIGSGRIGPALAGLLAEGGGEGAELAAWAPAGREEMPAWAARAGAEPTADWRTLIEGVDGVVVDLAQDLHWHQREVLAEATFTAGRALMVDAPLADFPQVYDRIQAVRRMTGARLWSVRPLRRTLAAEAALAEIASGALGGLIAMSASLHLAAATADASFEQALCDLLDAALALAGARVERVFAEGERSPDGSIEALTAVASASGGAALTLEVAKILPPSLGEGREVVIEATGREGLVRVEPERAALTIAAAGVRRVAWREQTIAEACAAWLRGADETSADAEDDRRVIAAFRMIKRSRARGEAETPEGAGVAG